MKKSQLTTWVATAIGAASIFAAIAFNGAQMAHAEHSKASNNQTKINVALAPEVNVIHVTGEDVRATVHGFGEVQAEHRLTLVAQVSGKVSQLASQFATGGRFNQGEVMLTLDKAPYLQALANAEVTLANAQLALQQEQRNSAQALAEWQRSGLAEHESASDLVLRKPQLKAAQAQVTFAQRALENAQYDLSQTEIRAPFNALVVTRDVQPGRFVQAGTQVASLYSTDWVEIRVPLSEQEWRNLPVSLQTADHANNSAFAAHLNDALRANIHSTDNAHHWPARIARVEAHVDLQSRQRALVVAVAQPLAYETPLLDGTYVQVDIHGKSLRNVWKLPASALTQQGHVWYVDQQEKLAQFQPQLRFREGNAIYIDPLVTDASLTTHTALQHELDIVAKPLSSYLPGMKVMKVMQSTASMNAAADTSPTHHSPAHMAHQVQESSL